jgi:hypothetical protein
MPISVLLTSAAVKQAYEKSQICMNMQSIAVSELNIYAAIFDAAIHFCITRLFLLPVCSWA